VRVVPDIAALIRATRSDIRGVAVTIMVHTSAISRR
jgi:hypothetical protein